MPNILITYTILVSIVMLDIFSRLFAVNYKSPWPTEGKIVVSDRWLLTSKELDTPHNTLLSLSDRPPRPSTCELLKDGGRRSGFS